MTNFLSSTMRRFSRSSSVRNQGSVQTPPSSYIQPHGTSVGQGSSIRSVGSSNKGITALPQGSTASSIHSVSAPVHSTAPSSQQYSAPYSSDPVPAAAAVGSMPNGMANDSRPISSATDQSFDFANRPVSGRSGIGAMPQHSQQPQQIQQQPVQQLQQQQQQQQHLHQPQQSLNSPRTSVFPVPSHSSMLGGLSRTDQIVLRHFWESKYQENIKRDLHYFPAHKDLLPYCEIYHLVKTSPGASIISLGSTNGVYIGFELQTGSQLHIDMDDEWQNISHHRVQFKSYENMIRDPASDAIFKSWTKPLTIEFLEEQYQKWCLDLMSLCWEGKEVRELGGGSAGAGGPAPSSAATAHGGPGVGGVNGIGEDRKF